MGRYGWRVKRLLPYGCLLAAAALAFLVRPPAKLVELIGPPAIWSRLCLLVVVGVVLFMFLVVLGLAAGKVGLPFGLSLERSPEPAGAGIEALEALAREILELRRADERVFERVGAVAALLERASEQIAALEMLVGPDRPEPG
ncbi:MAG: hypothetical protein QOJ63_2314 [Solirubrobacteraceae bacterium]|jgi:predicted PurR-regulated permease PerM|nr:hypothetical protein [Solirubrobacteraceae bacterium]